MVCPSEFQKDMKASSSGQQFSTWYSEANTPLTMPARSRRPFSNFEISTALAQIRNLGQCGAPVRIRGFSLFHHDL